MDGQLIEIDDAVVHRIQMTCRPLSYTTCIGIKTICSSLELRLSICGWGLGFLDIGLGTSFETNSNGFC